MNYTKILTAMLGLLLTFSTISFASAEKKTISDIIDITVFTDQQTQTPCSHPTGTAALGTNRCSTNAGTSCVCTYKRIGTGIGAGGGTFKAKWVCSSCNAGTTCDSNTFTCKR